MSCIIDTNAMISVKCLFTALLCENWVSSRSHDKQEECKMSKSHMNHAVSEPRKPSKGLLANLRVRSIDWLDLIRITMILAIFVTLFMVSEMIPIDHNKPPMLFPECLRFLCQTLTQLRKSTQVAPIVVTKNREIGIIAIQIQCLHINLRERLCTMELWQRYYRPAIEDEC